VEWLNYADRAEARAIPLPRSLANLKQEISVKKWAEVRQWVGGRTPRKKYKMPASQKPGRTVAGIIKRLASRFYQIKSGTADLGSASTGRRAGPPRSAHGVITGLRLGSTSSKSARSGRPMRKSCGRRCGDREMEEPIKDPGPPRRREA